MNVPAPAAWTLTRDADGIAWLERRQRDGTWTEEPFTGTGFPKVFYLRYHLYRHYFPLQALARHARM